MSDVSLFFLGQGCYPPLLLSSSLCDVLATADIRYYTYRNFYFKILQGVLWLPKPVMACMRLMINYVCATLPLLVRWPQLIPRHTFFFLKSDEGMGDMRARVKPHIMKRAFFAFFLLPSRDI